jgi:hypothetical protein
MFWRDLFGARIQRVKSPRIQKPRMLLSHRRRVILDRATTEFNLVSATGSS